MSDVILGNYWVQVGGGLEGESGGMFVHVSVCVLCHYKQLLGAGGWVGGWGSGGVFVHVGVCV